MFRLNARRKHEREVRWCIIDEDTQMKGNLKLFDHNHPLGLSLPPERCLAELDSAKLSHLRLFKPIPLLISLYMLESLESQGTEEFRINIERRRSSMR